jgi:5'-nucleotidase / UDP-sugar diphosphatase
MKVQRLAHYGFVFICIFATFSGVAGASSPDAAGQPHPWKLTILHINDPHAHYAPAPAASDPNIIGGFARIAHIVGKVRKENEEKGIPTLVLMGGDLLTGTVFSSVWKGAVGVKLMNKMGFDAMVVGNHEFDYGADHLMKTLKPNMEFPLVSANIVDSTGTALFPGTLEKKTPFAPDRIVILGLTTTYTPTATHPKNVAGLTFFDPIETAHRIMERYSDEDVVIALTHLGAKEDVRLGAAVPKLDVIVGGHSHTALFDPLKAGDCLIVQAGAYSMYVGRLDLTISKGRIIDYTERLIPMLKDVPEDPQIAEIVASYKGELDERLNEVVGTTEIRLEGTRSAVRSGKTTNLGTMIGHSMAAQVQAGAAVVNGGAIRDGFTPGDITLNQLHTVLPFADQVVKLGMRGRDLIAVLERSESLEPGSGGKLQTYGIFHHTKDGKTVIERVGDKPFSPDEIYQIATNDFLAEGGDGYTVLRDNATDRYESGVSLSAALLEAIRRNPTITEAFVESLVK